MGELKQINIKNRSYYFYNDIIDLKNFYARLLKNHSKTLIFTTLDMQQQKIDACNNIDSVNLLYLRIDRANGYTEEKMEKNIWFLILLMKMKSY